MAFPSISTPVTGGTFAAADGTTIQTTNASFVLYAGTSGSLATLTGQGKLSAGTYTEYGYHVDPGSALVEGTLDIPVRPANGNGIWFNTFSGTTPGTTSSDRNGHQIEWDPAATDALFIYTVVNGTNTQVATSTATTFANGDSIGFRISGTTNRLIEIFKKTGGTWNQTPVLTFTDTGAPANRQDVNSFAIGMTDSTSRAGRIDNLVLGATSTAVDATVTAVPALSAGSAPAAVVSAGGTGATVNAVAALSAGSAPVGVIQAGASIAAVAALSAGSAPPANQIISIVVNAPTALSAGSAPPATVSGAGVAATVNAVPALSAGSAPVAVIQAGVATTAVPALSVGSAPAASSTQGVSVTAVPAVSVGQAPRPAITPQPAGAGSSVTLTTTFAEDAA